VSSTATSPIRFRVDPVNPGQFFACCGLLELADRLWSGAEAWFDHYGRAFCLRPYRPDKQPDYTPSAFARAIAECCLTNTMTESQIRRRDVLTSMPKKIRESNTALETEKKALDKLWREAPLILHEPFKLRLDWFLDERSGGSVFKTWAGQQSVFEIARGLKAHIEAGTWNQLPSEQWLVKREQTEGLPFNFDSDLGGLGSDLDAGFSLDPLKSIHVQVRPFIEFAGFIGLQRFRPARINAENRFRYHLWFDPLLPEVAASAACGLTTPSKTRVFQFRLLYRTKYLKSFLPAIPFKRSQL